MKINMLSIVLILIILTLTNINFNIVKKKYFLSDINQIIVSKESNFIQKQFSDLEKSKYLKMCTKLNGINYKYGGSSPEEGFDCSGLVVYLYNQLNCSWFNNDNYLVNDISSESLYRFNCVSESSISNLIAGDFIFFDADSNNVIEHVSVFSNFDEEKNVWVWDASDYPDGEIINKVSYRKINNFWKKNPKFGKPLKTLEVGSYWDLLIFP